MEAILILFEYGENHLRSVYCDMVNILTYLNGKINKITLITDITNTIVCNDAFTTLIELFPQIKNDILSIKELLISSITINKIIINKTKNIFNPTLNAKKIIDVFKNVPSELFLYISGHVLDRKYLLLPDGEKILIDVIKNLIKPNLIKYRAIIDTCYAENFYIEHIECDNIQIFSSDIKTVTKTGIYEGRFLLNLLAHLHIDADVRLLKSSFIIKNDDKHNLFI